MKNQHDSTDSAHATRSLVRRVYDFATRAHTKAFVMKIAVTLAAVTAFRRLAPQYEDTVFGGFIVAMACLLTIDAFVFLWRATSGASANSARQLSISGAESHVLRNVVNEAGEAGLIDDADPAMKEWRAALHSLVRRGMVTAYRPTRLGNSVNDLVRRGELVPDSDGGDHGRT